ncbi:hypothetical protein LCGC14_0838770 [marine sediment metagenome]|uniref:Uncharacterized protein n=1 Tax=marine sediment metagenome TaxID=412755 RepID=A0A0F9SL28_9ZZZZ
MKKQHHDEELTNYWKWISSLSPAVQKAQTNNWDETGRPRNSYPVTNAVISLLNASKNYAEFKEMYYEHNARYVEPTKCEDDCMMYWGIYYAGLNRVVDEMRSITNEGRGN